MWRTKKKKRLGKCANNKDPDGCAMMVKTFAVRWYILPYAVIPGSKIPDAHADLGFSRSRKLHTSHLMTKPTKCMCAQRRLRSAWAAVQSDQSLRCSHKESSYMQLPIERIAFTSICVHSIARN